MTRSALGIGAVLSAAALAMACSHEWDGYEPRVDSGGSAGNAAGTGGADGAGASSSSGPSAGGMATSSSAGSGGQPSTGGAGGAGGAPDPGCLPPGATGYPAEVLVDCPLAYHRLGEASGLTAGNEVAGPDGQLENGVVFGVAGAIVGDPDTAAHLDGVNDGIGLGDHFDFAGPVSFTVEAWVRPTVLDNVYRRVFSKEDYPGTGREGYLLFMRAPAPSDADENTLGFQFWVEGQYNAGVASTTAAPLAVWMHVVSRADAQSQQIALFVNGALVNQFPYLGSIVDNTAPLRWGARSNGMECFAGDLDELAIYGSALPDARITAHYQAGIGN